jgi:ribosome biogenesis GTPase
MRALVTKAHSGFFTLHTEDGRTIICQAAGRLKKGKFEEDAVAVGDWVEAEEIKSEGFAHGRITRVEPRKSSLSRMDPVVSLKEKLEIRQIIVANVDIVVFVFACAQPDFHSRMLDRYLVGAEAQKLPALIVASKVDLVGMDAAREMFADYIRLGYPVVFTGQGRPGGHPAGIEEMREALRGKLSVLTGKSGVGKSSLLNALKPGLALDVGKVSAVWKKGKHTTVVPELVRMDEHSWIADTPGLRSYAVWDVHAEELDGYFREFAPLVRHCAFNDCTHTRESGCAVIGAVAQGGISAARYDSYCRLRGELEHQPKW